MLESSENMGSWTDRIVRECRYEYPVHKYIQGKRNTCVDVGANVGGFIINYHYRFNHIYAYEPAAINLKQCRANLESRKIDNVTINKMAVDSTGGGFATLKKYNATENCGSFGTVDFTYDNGDGWTSEGGVEEVPTISLEEIIAEVGYIDLLKVDIEGAEYDFLFGKDLSQVGFIFMEIHNFLIEMGTQKKLVEWMIQTHDLLGPYDPDFKDYHQHLVLRNRND